MYLSLAMARVHDFFYAYRHILLLLLGILTGSIIGVVLPDAVDYLKPIGDIFLNLLFVSVIPLLFFAITSAVANIDGNGQLGRIVTVMIAVFVVTLIIAAVVTIAGLWIYPVSTPSGGAAVSSPVVSSDDTWGDRMVDFVSVGEFSNLLSRQHILAFVTFAFLVGIAVRRTGEQADTFKQFLESGNQVMQQLLSLIMLAGPVGLGAYFAYQVREIGPDLLGIYAKPLAFYYIFGLIFFFVFFSLYAGLADGPSGIKRYWKHNITPSLTAVSTCSSLATLPANIIAAKKMGIPDSVASVVIPLGNTLYKNGSALSSILKIYVAFSLLNWNFFELETMAIAVGITILVSMVAGGIPNGGFIGEMLMISIYGIPNEAVPAILIIGALVDPLATILNATGDTVAAMLVARFTRRRNNTVEVDIGKN